MAEIKLAIIGGSGLGELLGLESGQSLEIDTPFGPPSSPILLTRWNNVELMILQRHGPGHLLSPTHVQYRANIFALKVAGATHVLASGAVGSLREEIKPRDLVIADQVIDKTFLRASSFYDRAAVHVEFAEPFCPVMRRWLLAGASRAAKGVLADVKIHERGTYVCMEGPAFSTRAESEMHRAWGGDLIGMTVMPEAKLAREAELPYALIGLPTDYDCWKLASHGSKFELLQEIIGNLKEASRRSVLLIKAALENVAILKSEASPAQRALELGIWSDKSSIPLAEIERLRPLWGKYFSESPTPIPPPALES